MIKEYFTYYGADAFQMIVADYPNARHCEHSIMGTYYYSATINGEIVEKIFFLIQMY